MQTHLTDMSYIKWDHNNKYVDIEEHIYIAIMTYMPVGGHNVRKALSRGKLMLYPRAAILLSDVWT